VPHCGKVGLPDAGDGWLRARCTDQAIIGYEQAVDTGEDHAAFDEVAKDRAQER
jgi:hypothetical protein